METIQSATETKAIKDHKCNFCGDTILAGEIYFRSTHINDNLYSWKSHKHCHRLSYDLNMYDDCDEG